MVRTLGVRLYSMAHRRPALRAAVKLILDLSADESIAMRRMADQLGCSNDDAARTALRERLITGGYLELEHGLAEHTETAGEALTAARLLKDDNQPPLDGHPISLKAPSRDDGEIEYELGRTLRSLKARADELSTLESEINIKLQRARYISAELKDLGNSLNRIISETAIEDSVLVNRGQRQNPALGRYLHNGVKIQRGTIKDFIVQVLSDSRRGMTALDILGAVNERFEKNYDRTSLSPQLSRLRTDGLLALRGTVWYLVTDADLSS